MSNTTSISDEDLIEELRRYGETNLPVLASSSISAASRKKAGVKQLNDQNRDIYLKKLNHYRAKEKAESNPSKYLKQQHNQTTLIKEQPIEYDNESRRSTNRSRKSVNFNNDYDNLNENDDRKDIIELNETSEYVQVSNAYTSPLSMTQFPHDDSNGRMSFGGDAHSTKIASPLQNKDLNYVKLKDRIELDKTLSKYRSEINSIINKSIVNKKSEPSVLNKLLNGNDEKAEAEDDVIYTGSYSNPRNSKSSQKTLYCPKPDKTEEKKSLFNSIRFPFSRSSTSQEETANTRSSQINNDNLRLRHAVHNRVNDEFQNSNNYLPQPVKEQTNEMNGIKGNFLNWIFHKVVPFISHLGLQLSKLLPYLVVIIFTIIILQYLRMKFQSSDSPIIDVPISSNNEKIEITKHNFCDDVKNLRCSQTKLMVKDTIDYLRLKAGKIDCSANEAETVSYVNKEQPPDFIEKCVHLSAITEYLDAERSLIKPKTYTQEAITSMINAISKNPHWGLRLLTSSYSDTNDSEQVEYIMSTVSSKSFTCRARELIHFLYLRVIMVISIITALVLIYLIYKAYAKKSLESDRAFYNLVSQVTNMVEKHYELSLLDPTNIKPYIAISHIYDTLFDASQRAAQKKLWNNVVKFIQNHESRIHLETQFIDGEETHVWKWVVPKHLQKITNTNHKADGIGLANSTMLTQDNIAQLSNPNQNSNNQWISSNTSNGYKENINSQQSSNQQTQPIYPSLNTYLANGNTNGTVNGWQGDAFNRTNSLTHCPTPNLKIRHMLDQTRNEEHTLIAKIHNDILDKLSKQSNGNVSNPILHISCDSKSKEGCVYVKCISNEAAGQIYQALNATWYNGRLLNVKFLRNDRYLERFPESVNYITPLQPYNLNKL